MFRFTRKPEVVRVAEDGRATIPESLREKFGVETTDEVVLYADGGRLTVEEIRSSE